MQGLGTAGAPPVYIQGNADGVVISHMECPAFQPVNVYDEMDWIAHRSRAELRATLDGIIRQERDMLVLKLNSVVQRYTRQTA